MSSSISSSLSDDSLARSTRSEANLICLLPSSPIGTVLSRFKYSGVDWFGEGGMVFCIVDTTGFDEVD